MSSTIRKFHEKYFEILEDYFGVHFKQMRNKKQSLPKAVAKSCEAYSNQLADSVCDAFNQELMNIDWRAYSDCIRNLGGTKVLIEGTLTQELAEGNLIKRISLYADTIVFSGVIPRYHEYLRIRGISKKKVSPIARIFMEITGALTLLGLKEVFFADVEEPIVVISLPLAFSTSDLARSCFKIADHDALELCSHIFGRKFSSLKEFSSFVLKKRNAENLAESIRHPEFVEANIPVKDALLTTMKAIAFVEPDAQSQKDPELLVKAMNNQVVNATRKSTAQLISCSRLKAEPATISLDDWHILKWRFAKDNRILSKKLGMTKISANSQVLNALQLDDFKWLGNVPLEGIVRMREEGELQNLRDLLSKGVREIETVTDEEFVEVTKRVGYNLNEAFKGHKTQVKRLDEEFRRKYDFDVASLIVTGSMGMVSALFPPLAIVAGIIGGGSMIQIIRHIEEERSRREELRRKPIGLLFQAYQDSQTQKT